MKNPEHTLAKAVGLLETYMMRTINKIVTCRYCGIILFSDAKLKHFNSCPYLEIKREMETE